MHNKLIKTTFLLISVLFCSFTFGQKQLPEDVERQIKNYNTNAIKNRNAGNDNAAASYLNKIAFLYWEYYDYEYAIKYFEQVMTINIDLGNRHGEQKVIENIAMVYSDMERYDKSIEFFKKNLNLISPKKNKKDISSAINNLAIAYSNNGQYEKAIHYADSGLNISKSINNVKLMRSFYGIMYEAYDKLGNKEKSIECFNMYTSLDKLLQEKLYAEKDRQNKAKIQQAESEKMQAIEERDVKATQLEHTKDTLKRVEELSVQQKLEIQILNRDKEIKDLTIKQQESKLKAERMLRSGLLGIFIIVSVFSFLLFRAFKAKQKANIQLKKLYGELETKNQQILDSIKYASHIQEAILPIETSLRKELPGSFIFYLPRDIVSGDFYWYSKHGDDIFLAAIDCTGHGVPGAFMSMIGNTLLNEIVNENKVHVPSEVLTLLNEKVETTLKQGVDGESFSEDGMDITFLRFNKKTKTVQLALANHTACVFIGKKQKILEGDFFSIGGNVGGFDVSFTNHEIPIEEETNIYMFSDGFPDQFGGDRNQKYRTNRFLDFLQSIQPFDFDSHYEMIDNEYKNWKNDNRQVDDILVMGLKFLP